MAYFAQGGIPETDLSPAINIRDVSDGSLAVNGDAMFEIGGGFYKYNFSPFFSSRDYVIVCNGGAVLTQAD